MLILLNICKSRRLFEQSLYTAKM